MPRSGSKRKAAAASPAAARKSPRAAAAPPPVESPSPRKSRAAAAQESPAPKRSTRKSSPSPAPVSRTQSRGRSGRAAQKQEETKTESPAQKKTRGRSQQGQGDEETKGKGRVTRAVVQEVEAKGKSSRSASKESPKAKAAQSRSTSRQKQSAAASKAATPKSKGRAKTPKGGRGSRGKVEVEEDEEEEEEEEETTPKSKSKAAKGRKSTPKAAAKKSTPKKSPAKAAAKSSPRGRSTSRGKKGGSASSKLSDLTEPQVVLTKIDDSPALSPEKKRTPVKRDGSAAAQGTKGTESTPSPRKARSRGTPTKKTPETCPKESSTQDTEETETEDLAADTASKEATKDVKEDTMDSGEVKGEGAEEKAEESKQQSEAVTDQEEGAMETDEQNVPEEEGKDTAAEDEAAKVEEDAMGKPSEEPEVQDEDVEEKMAVQEVDTEEKKKEDAVMDDAKDVCDGTEQDANEDVAPVTVNESAEDKANGTSQDLSEAVSPSRKRKFEELNDGEEEEASPKKVKLVNEEVVAQENGEQNMNEIETEVVEETVNEIQDVANDIEETMETDVLEAQQVVNNAEADVAKDYVVVDIQEVPAADSEEVMGSLPKAVTEETSITADTGEQPVVAEAQDTVPVPEEPITTEVQPDIVSLPECQPVESEVVVEQTVPNSEPVQSEIITEQDSSSVNQEPALVAESSVVENESKAATATNDQDWVMNRKFIPNPAFNASDSDIAKQFNIVSYNILAQCHLERNDYSFTDPECLLLNQRHAKMMEELKYLDGDVVCMQEVGPTYYEDVLYPSMKSLGYEGLMMKRTDDYYEEGEATFYRASRFTLVDFQTYSFSKLAEKELDGLEEGVKTGIRRYLDRPDVLIVAQFKCNNTENLVTIGNTHIHWGRMEVPDVQCVQIVSAMKELVRKAGGSTSAHILCGDFNSEVTSAGYQISTEGKLSDDMIQTLLDLKNVEMPNGEMASLLSQIMPAFQLTCGLRSSYKVAQGHEPVITSYNRVMRAAVDYIFYSDYCLDNVGVLEVPPESAVTGTGGIPDEVFPSDHVSIKAKLSFR